MSTTTVGIELKDGERLVKVSAGTLARIEELARLWNTGVPRALEIALDVAYNREAQIAFWESKKA